MKYWNIGFLWVCLSLSPLASADLGIQHWVTSKGATVYFVPSPDLPMIDINVVFDAGSARDGHQAGLAKLTNALLDQGAGTLNADQIADAIDNVGAQLGNSSLRDMATVSLRSLTDPALFDPALAVFAQILQAPTFSADAYTRIKQQLLAIVEKQKESPRSIAALKFYAAMYGDHPYASPTTGTTASLAQITRADVAAYYQRYYVAKNALVAIVGAVSREQAESIAETLTQHLAVGQAAAKLPEPKALTQSQVIRVDFPSSQSHVYVGQPGMHRTEPDYLPLYLGNHSLGGSGLVSILAEEIREKRGLSYSVYSAFSPMAQKGPFLAGLQTKNTQVDEALAVLMSTLTDFIQAGPTEAQLTASKNNIIGGFALRVDSNAKILGYLAVIGFYGLPLDYVDTFIARTRAVSREQIRTALQKHLQPQHMVTVIVGGKL